ncbi:hypothetical protein HBI07_248590 [Parastagonospora nodorum]|nr:hypothetical protein HBI07_248590 [Parastagonospora nodorum]
MVSDHKHRTHHDTAQPGALCASDLPIFYNLIYSFHDRAGPGMWRVWGSGRRVVVTSARSGLAQVRHPNQFSLKPRNAIWAIQGRNFDAFIPRLRDVPQ